MYKRQPYNERNRIALITNGILKKINGPPDTVVSIMYVDENEENQEKKIVRVQRSGKEFFFNEKMRPFLIEFEAKYLDDNIGYICDRIRKSIFSKMSTLQLLQAKLDDVFYLGTSVNGEGCATFCVRICLKFVLKRGTGPEYELY